jgi:hypothetical protein
VLAPGLVQIDMGVVRNFQTRERQAVQFRAEAFNLGNRVNLSPTDPTTPSFTSTGFNILNSSSFGRFLAAYDPRILQFALKYVF